jgi:hypothetical protein
MRAEAKGEADDSRHGRFRRVMLGKEQRGGRVAAGQGTALKHLDAESARVAFWHGRDPVTENPLARKATKIVLGVQAS